MTMQCQHIWQEHKATTREYQPLVPFKCNKLHQGNNHGQGKNRILEKQKGLTQRHPDAQINSNCIKQKKTLVSKLEALMSKLEAWMSKMEAWMKWLVA